MSPEAVREAFMLEFSTGRLFWKKPPPNHSEKLGSEAGYLCRGKGKNKSYWQIRFGGKTFKRSQVVFAIVNGHWPKPMCDHRNGNSLDDRPDNLREATSRQNAQNVRHRQKLSFFPRGVEAYRGRFRARIHIDGKCNVIGIFETPDAASAAYQSARMEAFGEYA